MRHALALTAPQRLGLLLPWLNRRDDDARWEVEGRRAVRRFLVSFDGSAAAGHVELWRRATDVPRFIRAGTRQPLDRDALETLHADLHVLLESGFGGDLPGAMPMPSLRFGVRSAGRGAVKLSGLTRRERRTYASSGAYVLQVTGRTPDVVMYLALHLLTAPGMAGAIGRCAAPAPGNWRGRCNRWILRTGHGRKREYCGDACRWRLGNAKNNALVSKRRRAD